MKHYTIKVDTLLQEKIIKHAKVKNISEEEFITQILSRYVLDPHMMESVEVQEGYKVCGPINVELANL